MIGLGAMSIVRDAVGGAATGVVGGSGGGLLCWIATAYPLSNAGESYIFL